MQTGQGQSPGRFFMISTRRGILLRRIVYLIILGCLLAGCQTAAPIVENTPVPPAAAATATTVVPEPAATLPPPATSTVVPTATAVSPPTATAIPSPTPFVPEPAGRIGLERIADGFFKPLGIEHAGDGRLFVLEQTGTIRILENGQVRPAPFLDITDRVNSNANEQGLLGLAFHPAYAANGRFFLNYSRFDGATVIAEYRVNTADPNTADRNSEKVLLVIAQPYENHNGGQIRFGPDGYLYIGMGDGGSQGDPLNAGQSPDNLLGSLLRIDVDRGDPYGIPAGNPFAGDPAARPEIWAKGLRNPWRFSFDRETGDLFIADVGQNEWEEINFQPAGSAGGENYGWRRYEGSHCYTGGCSDAGLIMPIGEYSHAGGHCSVTGGFVYRGADFPELRENYFFADYCSGTFWRLFPLADGTWDQAAVGRVPILVSSFGEDLNGELYVTSHAEGAVYRLIP